MPDNEKALSCSEEDWVFTPSDCAISKKHLKDYKEEFLRTLSFWKNFALTQYKGDAKQVSLHLPFPPGDEQRFRASMESSKPGFTAFTNFIKTHFGERWPDSSVELVRGKRLWKLSAVATERLDIPLSWVKGMVKHKPFKLIWLIRKLQVSAIEELNSLIILK